MKSTKPKYSELVMISEEAKKRGDSFATTQLNGSLHAITQRNGFTVIEKGQTPTEWSPSGV
jgi:hypothetical protein